MHCPHTFEEISTENGVSYSVKFEGIFNVGEPNGKSAVVSAYMDLQRQKNMRKKLHQKAPIYQVYLSTKQIQLYPQRSREDPLTLPLNKISYCTQQNPYVNYVFFIFTEKMPTSDKLSMENEIISHRCVIIKHKKQTKAREIVHTFAECMQIYSQSKATDDKNPPPSPSATDGNHQPNENNNNHVEIEKLTKENDILKKRLISISILVPQTFLDQFLASNQLTNITEINLSSNSNPVQINTRPMSLFGFENDHHQTAFPAPKPRSQTQTKLLQLEKQLEVNNPNVTTTTTSPPQNHFLSEFDPLYDFK